MEQYNITSTHYYGDKHKFLAKIISFIDLQKDNTILESFIRQFYFNVPMINLTFDECKQKFISASHVLDLALNRKPGQNIINFYKTVDVSGNNVSIIDIICDDSPFLVDSTIALFKREDIEILEIFYPVISVNRDKKDNLVSISNEKTKDSIQESFIHIKIDEIKDINLQKNLENSLKNILSNVQIAVSDWKNILGVLHKYNNYYEKNNSNDEISQERKEFLNLLESKYFVFLASAEYSFTKTSPKHLQPILNPNSLLGILRIDNGEIQNQIIDTVFNQIFFKNSTNKYIEIGKLNKASIVHRNVNIDYVCLKEFNSNGDLEKATVFLGLFTSILYYQSVTLIPLIRKKLSYVLKKSNLGAGGHGGKELISLMESLPRDELFQISKDQLYRLIMEAYALQFSPGLKLFIRQNENGKFINSMIFLPTIRAHKAKSKAIQNILSNHFGKIITFNYLPFGNYNLSYYHVILDGKHNKQEKFNLNLIEQELDSATSAWPERLKNVLQTHTSFNQSNKIYYNYEDAFPSSYTEKFSPETAVEDIKVFEQLTIENDLSFKLVVSSNKHHETDIELNIYSINKIALTDIMPILQNMGFNVIDEYVFLVNVKNKTPIWLQSFNIDTSEYNIDQVEKVKSNIEDTLLAIFRNVAQNDNHNKLLLKAALSYKQVTLIRAFGKYLAQVGISYSKEYLGEILTSYPSLTSLLVELFYERFDPTSKNQNSREASVKSILNRIDSNMTKVQDSSADKLIRRYIELIQNIIRTNYFQTDENNLNKSYISFKIDSYNLLSLPLPRPYYEIFVYSSQFEAIHLRSGKVARGGIRWSDRKEDFRTEVLGLMKAQVDKNSVIVPVGAKGGFVVKDCLHLDKENYFKYGIECYKNFLRGMLDITDNIINGEIVYPKNVVRYDEDDPYLVVAADKGTATFSDYANSISKEYNFWLSDAFASGGSAGYDHKKMAITARGAWISVERHFNELDIDIHKNDFRVVGIGDMSGDVFGNGMLLSKHIKLIAAFNHMHIFIDPNPDASKSYAERLRLFKLPRSSWTDYDPSVISKGGMIFSRQAKILELNKEIKECLNISQNKITPDELIQSILKADVDLLWNGGIGTYVKSKEENNINVGDKTNDLVRVNGEDLKCKVVGEGGNLGFTQLGRIEYAFNGGKINTDAIDNSAGVDCSDHEVNIKIILNSLVQAGKLSIEDRNILLSNMQEEVAELVLKDNILQTLAVTLSEYQNYNFLESYERFIKKLESEGNFDRNLEKLPSKQEFIRRSQLKKGLTRPELSVILAFSKNSIYQKLLKSKLPDDEYFLNDLKNYFPKLMQDKFIDDINNHPLRREIISTSVTNSIVNRIAPFFMHLTAEDMGRDYDDIARAYIITREIFDLRKYWNEIKELDHKIPVEVQSELYIEIKRFTMRLTSWLLRNYNVSIDISEVTNFFKSGVQILYDNIEKHIKGKNRGDLFKIRYNYYKDKNVPSNLARNIALLNPMFASYNIIYVANKHSLPINDVSKLYFEIGEIFNFEWLRLSADNLPSDNSWQRLATRGFKDELYDIHRKLTSDVISETPNSNTDNLRIWLNNNHINITRYEKFIEDLKSQETIDFSMLSLALNRINQIIAA